MELSKVEGVASKKSGKRLLNVSETALYLGLSKQTIYNGIAPKCRRYREPPQNRYLGQASLGISTDPCLDIPA